MTLDYELLIQHICMKGLTILVLLCFQIHLFYYFLLECYRLSISWDRTDSDWTRLIFDVQTNLKPKIS